MRALYLIITALLFNFTNLLKPDRYYISKDLGYQYQLLLKENGRYYYLSETHASDGRWGRRTQDKGFIGTDYFTRDSLSNVRSVTSGYLEIDSALFQFQSDSSLILSLLPDHPMEYVLKDSISSEMRNWVRWCETDESIR